MTPLRYARLRRYRISSDILAVILEYLDPKSLFFACKAFKRVYGIVMEYHALRYKFELVVSGMRDGAAPRAVAPLLGRLHLLMSYRTDWPRLHWTHEYKMQVITPSHVGTSGGFMHQIRPHGIYDTLEITELPSCRTGRSPALTRRLRFTSPPIEIICIDSAQALIVAAHIFCQNGIVGLQLQFRDLWSFDKHPRAPAESYEIPTQSVAPVSHAAISVFGSKMAMTFEFVGGKINHLIMDWRTFGARWIDDQDIYLLDEDLLLVLCKRGNSPPIINLCGITNIADMVVLRQYELPGTWNNSFIKFCPNTSPRLRSPTALFYSDPANRVLVMTAKPLGKHSSPRNWLFINEGYFRGAPSRRERLAVPWNSWGQYCLVKDLSRSRAAIRGPYAIGSRVVFLESEKTVAGFAASLNLIEFAPFPDSSTRLDPTWSMTGPRSTLFPSETARHLPPTTVEHYAVDDIGVTEDNIVLFLELQPGFRPVNVLTFGAPPTRLSHR
ncbi:hypothetical protein DFH07DRAFT_393004 [Mycena maculata]|uniref:F-box domain-containing protein n=1 Tax=Mycena maculata TaxID=230809 RepID=A0AAD7KCY3_9AGAR|nr:hypothetical protein DFH07DRAFT_393004 [Mycena maculata]